MGRRALVTLLVAGCGRIGFDGVRDSTQAGSCGLAAVAVGKHHTCVLRGDGSVACWDGNEESELARPPSGPGLTAAAIPLAQPATAIAAGATHTCALLADNSVACWGANNNSSGARPEPRRDRDRRRRVSHLCGAHRRRHGVLG